MPPNCNSLDEHLFSNTHRRIHAGMQACSQQSTFYWKVLPRIGGADPFFGQERRPSHRSNSPILTKAVVQNFRIFSSDGPRTLGKKKVKKKKFFTEKPKIKIKSVDAQFCYLHFLHHLLCVSLAYRFPQQRWTSPWGVLCAWTTMVFSSWWKTTTRKLRLASISRWI